MSGRGVTADAAAGSAAAADLPLLRPAAWPAASGSAMSTRRGGISAAPFDDLNLGARRGGGDDPAAVAENRRRFAAALGARPVFLAQVHGTAVVRLGAADAEPGAPVHEADAAVTTVPGLACTVLVADCLPVLLADRHGRVVGAAHAGWRGLAGGVVEATIAALRAAGEGVAPADLVAWLGACIGPQAFEVGAEVPAAFGAVDAGHFRAAPARDGVPKWFGDLPALAAARLTRAGVHEIYRAGACTVADPSRFFSYRRDGRSGRLAAAVWLRSGRG